jgi:hypothetical protein
LPEKLERLRQMALAAGEKRSVGHASALKPFAR